MKLQIASDLHLEFLNSFEKAGALAGQHGLVQPAQTGAEVLVLAGDIGHGTTAIDTFKDHPVPVIFCAGNHEHYGSVAQDVLEQCRLAARGTSVHFLENEQIVIGNVRFIGSTLWTDGRCGSGSMEERQRTLEAGVNDYRMIRKRLSSGEEQPITAEDTIAWHRAAREYLEKVLAQPFPGPTVVVTHHLPALGCVNPRYASSPYNGAFVSDLEKLMGPAVSLWVHGHTHSPVDLRIKGTRILCNPRGYVHARNPNGVRSWSDLVFENRDFDPARVVEI